MLFRTKDEQSDLLIADFGLSKMIDEDTYSTLTTVCGTPGAWDGRKEAGILADASSAICAGYMAPEVRCAGVCNRQGFAGG